MWADNETSEDLLGFKVHADLLIDVINDEKMLPVTIGVFGDWGSGKSSILKIINDELSGPKGKLKDKTLVLYFNGWVFEGYDDAKAALLESIINGFKEHRTLGGKVTEEANKLLKSVDWMRIMSFGFKNIAVPAVTASLTGGLSIIPSLVQTFSMTDPKELLEKLQGEDAGSFLKESVKQEDDIPMMVRTFRDDFKAMIDKSKINKLVILIDDLDRCTPDRIIENLEAVKLFLNVDKTAFIIGADPRIVRHAIEHKYKTGSTESSTNQDNKNDRIVTDYLEKLIQVPYTLPKLSDHEVETYMTLLFCKKELSPEAFTSVHSTFNDYRIKDRYGVFGLGDVQGLISAPEKIKLNESFSLLASLSGIITKGLNGNPRQIKRFLNTFMLRKRLVDVARLHDFKIDILAKLMVLEYTSSDLFRKLYDLQVVQNGKPKEIIEMEQLIKEESFETQSLPPEWQLERNLRWLKTEPQLSDVDLRDYYWISRDQLTDSISGGSLISPYIRTLFKKLITFPSANILKNTVSDEVRTLNEAELLILTTLLEKELSKQPEDGKLHTVYIAMIEEDIPLSFLSYEKLLKSIDCSKIPPSLYSIFKLCERKIPAIASLYNLFPVGTRIYKAFNELS